MYIKTTCLSLDENGTDLRLCSEFTKVGIFQLFKKFHFSKTQRNSRLTSLTKKSMKLFSHSFQNYVVNKEKRILESIAAKTTSRQLVRLKTGGTKIQQ